MITLYFSQGWMPCCVVRMVAKAVGVQLYLIRIDIRKEENKTPEYRAVSILILNKINVINFDKSEFLWMFR